MNFMEKERTASKRRFSPLLPAYAIVFAFCFMLFIYEPFLMYSTNKNDFWFDFSIMLLPTFLIFAVILAAGIVSVTAFYFIVSRFSKGQTVYRCAVAFLFVVFLATYIQGVYLSLSLPVLTGEPIKWDSYLKEDIITLLLWGILEVGLVLALMKWGSQRVVAWACRISAAIVALLLMGLLPQMIKNDAFQSKDALLLTKQHMHDISADKNFLIFIVDAVDAECFEDVLADNEAYRDVFRDFTYYSNTASVYPYTRDSEPLILSGEINRNEKAFEDYCSDAYNQSKLFERLDRENYVISLYMPEPVWYGEGGKRSFEIVNDIKNSADSPYQSMNYNLYFRQEMKYILFKYLPYAYKHYSQIEGFDFGMALEQYRYYNDEVYESLVAHSELEKIDRNVFQLLHIEGAHVPFQCDKNLNPIKKGTYSQKIEASIKVVDTYLTRLRNNDAYDNSVILIMADHGYYDVDHENAGEEILERFHPILLIKGYGEKHELARSDLPVSQLDLMDAYMALLDGKMGNEVFSDIEADRKRQVIWYEYRGEDHMVEYELEGNSFHRQDFKATGRVFDR